MKREKYTTATACRQPGVRADSGGRIHELGQGNGDGGRSRPWSRYPHQAMPRGLMSFSAVDAPCRQRQGGSRLRSRQGRVRTDLEIRTSTSPSQKAKKLPRPLCCPGFQSGRRGPDPNTSSSSTGDNISLCALCPCRLQVKIQDLVDGSKPLWTFNPWRVRALFLILMHLVPGENPGLQLKVGIEAQILKSHWVRHCSQLTPQNILHSPNPGSCEEK